MHLALLIVIAAGCSWLPVVASAEQAAADSAPTQIAEPAELPPDAPPDLPPEQMLAQPEFGEPNAMAMATDLERILSGLANAPAATLASLIPEVEAQAGALPALVAQGLRELASEEPGPLGDGRVVLLCLLLVCVLIAGLCLLGKSWVGFAFVLAVFGAPLLAAFSGFVALSLTVMALAIVTPLLAVVLRAALARPGGDDPRWQPRPNQVVPKSPQAQTPPRPSARPQSAANPVRQALHPVPAASRPATAPSQPAASSSRSAARPIVLTAEDWHLLKQQLGAAGVLPRLHSWHFALLLFLLVVAPPLAVFAVVGAPIYFIYRIATLDPVARERLLAHPRVRERLAQLQQANPELYQKLAQVQQSLESVKKNRAPR